MKIISKHKDYYDYMCHIHGVDNKLVLDRRDSDYTDSFLLYNRDKLVASYQG